MTPQGTSFNLVKYSSPFLDKFKMFYYPEQVRNQPDVPPFLVCRRLSGPHTLLRPPLHRRGQLRGDHQDAAQRASHGPQEISNSRIHRLLRFRWSSTHRPKVFLYFDNGTNPNLKLVFKYAKIARY